MKQWKWQVAFFVLIYLLLPNSNPSSDALGYAAEVRWNGSLWSAHHLLYNAWCLLLWKCALPFHDFEPLPLLQAGNALAAGAVLWITGLLLDRFRREYSAAAVVFTGSSFGFMRYATENETYIMPLLFGVLALWFLTGNLRGKGWWTALSLALAMLFHQTYIFWWMAMVWYVWRSEGWRQALKPAAALPAVAIVYALVAYTEGASLWRFLFHDVYEGGVQTTVSERNFIMTPVSLLRSFLQVHGYIFWSWKHDGLWSQLMSTAVFGLLAISLLKLVRGLQHPVKHNLLQLFLLPAFILHLLFAFYSEGNAEFMVMIPFLFACGISVCAPVQANRLFLTGVCMLCWNLLHGLLPWHFRDFYGHNQLFQIWVNRTPDTYLVSEEPVMMRNLYYYHSGIEDSQLILDSPDWAISKGGSADSAIMAIDSVLKQPYKFVWYADYSRYLLNRASLTSAKHGIKGMERFNLVKADSFRNMHGLNHIYRLE